MLKVKIESESGTTYKNIIVIDAHSHLGKDVDGAEMLNPLAAGRGTFDFWSAIEGKIIQDWGGETHSFTTNIGGKDYILTFSFGQLPFVKKIFTMLEKIGSPSYKDLAKKTQHQNFIDQAVVFPFQDVFRDKMPEARYRASNINVARFTTRFPFSIRLIGYMRCDPMEGQKAVDEVDFAYSIGLRGLKLHPRSEGWIDNINSPKAVRVMANAAKYSMPIIFDTRGKASILGIAELVDSTRNYLKNNAPELLPHLKVIIAHFAQGNVDDYEVYSAITRPNTWGDLSMLHGKGSENFIKSYMKWFKESGMERVDGRKWSQYLLYATDFPYFGAPHVKGLLEYLMSKDFYDNGGTLDDAENILGLNQLRLLPEYNTKTIKPAEKPATVLITAPGGVGSSSDIAIQTLAEMLSGGMVDIHKLLFQFDGGYRNYKGDVLLALKRGGKKSDEILNMMIMDMVKDKVTLMSIIGSDGWKKFGYKYFNPDDRRFFHSLFETSALAVDSKTALQYLKNALV